MARHNVHLLGRQIDIQINLLLLATFCIANFLVQTIMRSTYTVLSYYFEYMTNLKTSSVTVSRGASASVIPSLLLISATGAPQ